MFYIKHLQRAGLLLCVGSIVFNLIETAYFGWNLLPKSTLESDLDSWSQVMFVYGAVLLALAFVYDSFTSCRPPRKVTGFKVVDRNTGRVPSTHDLQNMVLNEPWAKTLVYCDVDEFAMQQDGSLALLDDCGNVAYCPPGRFEIRWLTE